MKRRPKEKKAVRTLGPFRKAARVAITAFVALHVSAMAWWLIPANGYPRDYRSAELPAWITRAEQAVFEWKRDSYGTILAPVFERYIFITATWQKWWLFAPNPMQIHDWITVKAVIDWKQPDPLRGPAGSKAEPWGDARQPVYDEEPLYKSYEGDLDGRMKGTARGYSHDPKLVENLASGNWDRPLASFAEYFGRVYRTKTGKRPLGIHVILNRGRIPPPYQDRSVASLPNEQRVLWYLHY
ncbi:MAG TPA: hypothetical protein VM598_03590 [Bdellovibrionota bacterium]|nr:hypothetical protein [Bdellovibrionota bacterium]